MIDEPLRDLLPDAAEPAGDDAAEQDQWKAFYTETGVEVFRIVQSLIQDREVAAEATDEAFYLAFTHWETFGPEASKRRSWVIRAALNEARDCFRRSRRRELREQRYEQQRPASPSLDQNAELVELRAAMARLAWQQRTVMVLRHVYGFDPREVAEILGIKVSTVGVHEYRARKRLREMLSGPGQEGPR